MAVAQQASQLVGGGQAPEPAADDQDVGHRLLILPHHTGFGRTPPGAPALSD
ncbi:MAG: hypothetical protein M3N31_08130 [Actinomycetota bacterium]|nr:hypothetical protein [Actinomycetota bacterium]